MSDKKPTTTRPCGCASIIELRREYHLSTHADERMEWGVRGEARIRAIECLDILAKIAPEPVQATPTCGNGSQCGFRDDVECAEHGGGVVQTTPTPERVTCMDCGDAASLVRECGCKAFTCGSRFECYEHHPSGVGTHTTMCPGRLVLDRTTNTITPEQAAEARPCDHDCTHVTCATWRAERRGAAAAQARIERIIEGLRDDYELVPQKAHAFRVALAAIRVEATDA